MRTRATALLVAAPVLVLCLVLMAGCNPATIPPQSAGARDETLAVFASIPPLASLVEQVGGDQVAVRTLLAPGQGPHTFTATPKQVMALAEAAAYFHVGGFPFELELAKRFQANFPSLEIQDVSRDVARLGGVPHDHVEASDEEHAHPAHEDSDPHVWMSPPLLETMAGTIAETLTRLDPGHAEDYARNLEATLAELRALDAEIRQKLGPFEGRTFYIYHPALGYFADTYGLHQESVETGGKKPAPRQLQGLIEQARRDGVRVIFVQPQFDQRSAESVADAIQGAVVSLDPLREDVVANLREIAARLAEGFAAENAP